jgi:hypothetical protein
MTNGVAASAIKPSQTSLLHGGQWHRVEILVPVKTNK